jgi:hypothetical protein
LGMNRRILIPAISLVLTAMAAFIGGTFQQDCYPEEISLKQAIEVCLPQALRWSSDARLAYAISTEAGEYSPAGSQGKGGLWSNWNVIFVEQKTGRNLLVAVRQGRMAYTKELLMAFKHPIDLTDLRFDSTEVISRLTSKNQSPGKVHFELVSQQSLVMRVYLSYSNMNPQITCIDGTTGKVISQWDGAVN